MKFIKKNKFTVLVIIVFIVTVIILFQVTKLFFPNNKTPIYGNRLDNNEKFKINNSKIVSLDNSLNELETVEKSLTTLKGRIINVHITVKNNVEVENAKKLSNEVLPYFTKKQLQYYDVQIFLKKEDIKLNNFPIIGYKHHTSTEFLWTKERVVKIDEK